MPNQIASRELLDLVLAASQDGVVIWDLQRGNVTYSDRWYHMFGYDPDAWSALGDGVNDPEFWISRVSPEVRSLVRDSLADHLGSGWPFGLTVPMEHCSGGYRYTLCRGASQEEPTGTRSRMVIVFSSVDEQVRAEARQRALLAGLPDTVLRIDGQGTIVGLRKGKERPDSPFSLLEEGARLKDAAGITPAFLTHIEQLSQITSGDPESAHRLKLILCGYHFEVRSVRLQDGEVVSVIRDITEQHALEMKLLESQKLGAIGQLAAGVAHEINTPMQFVGDSLYFAKDAVADLVRFTEDLRAIAVEQANDREVTEARVRTAESSADFEYIAEALPRCIERSLSGIDRVTKIVRALKTFAHPDDGTRAATDLKSLIASTVEVATNEWKYVANVSLSFEDELPLVPCFAGELSQVILNLLINAAHAISDVVGSTGAKGKIEVSARVVSDFVEIRVSDTGTGIPEAVRPRIFEQFFTTKEVGRGTGQGLAMAYSCITAQHNGTITFESEMGQGTTFVIRLPLKPAQRTQSGQAPRTVSQ